MNEFVKTSVNSAEMYMQSNKNWDIEIVILWLICDRKADKVESQELFLSVILTAQSEDFWQISF